MSHAMLIYIFVSSNEIMIVKDRWSIGVAVVIALVCSSREKVEHVCLGSSK